MLMKAQSFSICLCFHHSSFINLVYPECIILSRDHSAGKLANPKGDIGAYGLHLMSLSSQSAKRDGGKPKEHGLRPLFQQKENPFELSRATLCKPCPTCKGAEADLQTHFR